MQQNTNNMQGMQGMQGQGFQGHNQQQGNPLIIKFIEVTKTDVGTATF